MRKRTRYSLLLMLSLVAALIVAVVLRKTAPPEAARLLPESDAILYVNLKPCAQPPTSIAPPCLTARTTSISSTKPASTRSATWTPPLSRCTA